MFDRVLNTSLYLAPTGLLAKFTLEISEVSDSLNCFLYDWVKRLWENAKSFENKDLLFTMTTVQGKTSKVYLKQPDL